MSRRKKIKIKKPQFFFQFKVKMTKYLLKYKENNNRLIYFEYQTSKVTNQSWYFNQSQYPHIWQFTGHMSILPNLLSHLNTHILPSVSYHHHQSPPCQHLGITASLPNPHIWKKLQYGVECILKTTHTIIISTFTVNSKIIVYN